jgi:thiol-disulfide isomerase/thioredoxin
MKNNLFIGFVALIVFAGGYLALQKHLELYRQNKEHEILVENKLAAIEQKLEELQEYDQAHDAMIDVLDSIESFLDDHKERNSVITIDSPGGLRSLFEGNNQPAVLFFHMDGCGWCKKMAPVFEQTADSKEFAKIQFYSMDGRATQAVSLVQEFYHESINGYPFLLFIDENGVVGKQSGFSEQVKFQDAIKSSFKSIFPTFKAMKIEEKAVSSCAQRQQVEAQPTLAKPENIIEIKDQESLRVMLKNNTQQAVLFFHMDGCGWCKKMMPVFYAAAQIPVYKDIKFYSIDGKSAQAPMVVKELYDQFINRYPFLLFIDENGFVEKQSGFSQEDAFEHKIKEVFKK